MKIKTIDLQFKEWFDKVNGNSYFAGTITINYGMKSVKSVPVVFQYSYGDSYVDESRAVLTEHNYISPDHRQPLWGYCEVNNIILRANIQRNCLKRELMRIS